MEDKYEPFVPKQCHESYGPTIPYAKFGADESPVFSGVVVTKRLSVWDGVLSGWCEVRGEEFYFTDIIESCWRYYDVQHKKAYNGKKFQHIERLWRIFAVYALTKKEKSMLREAENALERHKLIQEYQPIGIFWDYTYAKEAGPLYLEEQPHD